VTEPDAVMTRVGEGIALSQRGDRAAARQLLTEVWDQVGPDGDPFHRCAIAHWLADVQDDERAELGWDLRALAAAELITGERARQAGLATPVRAMFPSLHLNLGDVYRRLGDAQRAAEHLRRGQADADALAEDGYGAMIRGGLSRLAERLAAGPASPAGSCPPGSARG
jgi:hypothetical protein